MTNFSLQIIDWYRRNKRDLPWRNTKNPYFIWLSEIILQQTRVDQGMNYYLKFVRNYPTVSDLAKANEQAVLNDWQGLGYYSRARNLHATAKMIVEKHGGTFPDNFGEIIQLKGIGEYTASAISSFAFQLQHAVVDGNVYRVLSRVFDIDLPIDSSQGQKEFAKLAKELLPEKDSDSYNQGIMEFGALYCVPKNPDCINCILNSNCLAFQNKSVASRPVKTGKIKIRKRYFYYFVIQNKEEIIVSKRTENDIWKHLYEFPKIESDKELNLEEISLLVHQKYKLGIQKIEVQKKHVLSHQHIFSSFITLNPLELTQLLLEENELLIKRESLSEYPLPRLIDRYLLEQNK